MSHFVLLQELYHIPELQLLVDSVELQEGMQRLMCKKAAQDRQSTCNGTRNKGENGLNHRKVDDMAVRSDSPVGQQHARSGSGWDSTHPKQL